LSMSPNVSDLLATRLLRLLSESDSESNTLRNHDGRNFRYKAQDLVTCGEFLFIAEEPSSQRSRSGPRAAIPISKMQRLLHNAKWRVSACFMCVVTLFKPEFSIPHSRIVIRD